MSNPDLRGTLNVNLEKLSVVVNRALPTLFVVFLLLGYYVSFYFHFLSITFFFLSTVNFIYLHIQTRHALLRNFGIIAQIRYVVESIGPEFRQYLYMSDNEERPFNRMERSEIYRKAKGIDSSAAFGSQVDVKLGALNLRHSMYPSEEEKLKAYSLTYGEERNSSKPYTITKPILISGMSYGSLGNRAVRALARGAKRSGIPMNTGEGGYPKYHLTEGCDLIFQMGTAKFGCRNEDSSLNEGLLEKIAGLDPIKMIEIKFSQGAKPGKGGILPKEKITEEIAELRNVPFGRDVISPPFHKECVDAGSTVKFIQRVQEVSQLPVGVKMCLGRDSELRELVRKMKDQNAFPDYISIDGAEGGTGAAPKSFMDNIGLPIFRALPLAQQVLIEEGVRDRLKLMAAGKLILPARQLMAFAYGAQAVYSARAFMLAIGCIQTLQCNKNSCPVGVTTHRPELQRGLDIEQKSDRVVHFVSNMMKEYKELQTALGVKSLFDLKPELLYQQDVAI